MKPGCESLAYVTILKARVKNTNLVHNTIVQRIVEREDFDRHCCGFSFVHQMLKVAQIVQAL